jgi:hypothetical protein
MARQRRRSSRKKELVGWLEMQKSDGSGKERISVYKKGNSVYLSRYSSGGRSYKHPVHAAAKGWIGEAASVWTDLTVQGSKFRSVAEMSRGILPPPP